MEIREVEVEGLSGIITHVIIDKGNNEFVSMTKAHYEALEAAKEAQSL